MPIAQPGICPEAVVNCEEFRFFREKYTPTATILIRYSRMINRSIMGSVFIWVVGVGRAA